MAKIKDFPPAVRKLVAERSGGVCERCGFARATDHHHRRLRQRTGPGNTHGAANDLHLCRGCHFTVHLRPLDSDLEGWMVASGFDPAATPVGRRGHKVLLTDDGDVLPATHLEVA